jgi:membrane-bound metal-dependent hydrolase YbcI (DUF457 family)
LHAYPHWPFVTDTRHAFVTAVWAFLVHGMISLAVVLPIVLAGNRRLAYGVLAFAAGPALDLDHAVASGSLNPKALETLSHRPYTHSLVFAVGLAVIALLVTRSRVAAWSVFAVIAVHLVFDASGGDERILYPLQRPNGLPWLAFPVGFAALTTMSWAIAHGRKPAATPRFVISQRSRESP